MVARGGVVAFAHGRLVVAAHGFFVVGTGRDHGFFCTKTAGFVGVGVRAANDGLFQKFDGFFAPNDGD